MCADGSCTAQVGQEEKGGQAVSGLTSPSGFGWEVIHRWVQGGFARNGGSSHNFGGRGDALPARRADACAHGCWDRVVPCFLLQAGREPSPGSWHTGTDMSCDLLGQSSLGPPLLHTLHPVWALPQQDLPPHVLLTPTAFYRGHFSAGIRSAGCACVPNRGVAQGGKGLTRCLLRP